MERIRLSPFEVEEIVKTAKEVFGKGVRVWLFGSRTDPTRKGGDIDLYIETPEGYELRKLTAFLARLYISLGERKIDVVLEKYGSSGEIAEEAKNKGVRLC